MLTIDTGDQRIKKASSRCDRFYLIASAAHGGHWQPASVNIETQSFDWRHISGKHRSQAEDVAYGLDEAKQGGGRRISHQLKCQD